MTDAVNEFATAEEAARNASKAGGSRPTQPCSADTIFVINANPRSQPKAPPAFPNPGKRPEGSEPPLVLDFRSPVLTEADIASGKMPRRETETYLRSIRDARDRSIIVKIDDAGGRAVDVLPIALALLQHPLRVEAKIIGRCSSSAVYLALAADVRSVVPIGTVMVHRAARICTSAQFEAMRLLSADAKAAISESLNGCDDVTEAFLTSRLGVSGKVARDWMRENRAWSAREALERGFVDMINEVEAA